MACIRGWLGCGLGRNCYGIRQLHSVDSLTWAAGKMMNAGVQLLLLRTGTSDEAACVPDRW